MFHTQLPGQDDSANLSNIDLIKQFICHICTIRFLRKHREIWAFPTTVCFILAHKKTIVNTQLYSCEATFIH